MKKRKSKLRKYKLKDVKAIIIWIIVIAIIVAGIVLFFTTDFFRTKRSAFFRYFNQIDTCLDVLKTDKFDSYIEKKEETPYVRDANASIQTSSNIADSAILDKIKFKLTEKVDRNNKKASSTLNITNGNDTIFTLKGIQNKDSYGLFSEDIASGFITVNNDGLKRIYKDWGAESTLLFPDVVRNIRINTILDTSKIEKNHINECVNIIKNDVPNTSYSKEGKKKIKINGNSYVTNAYKLSLNSADSTNLQVNILEKISKDSILMNYFASKFKLLNFDEEYTSVNSLNDLIKKRIQELKSNPNSTGDFEIILYEYRQKNVRCDIKINGQHICIDHLIEDGSEYSSITYNNDRFSLEKKDDKYYFEHENTSDENSTKKIRIEYSQNGNTNENNISNNMTITKTKGVRSITYIYTDTVKFTENIGKIDNYDSQDVAILNNYTDDDLKNFFEVLRKKINEVYIKKGSNVGINLDPIFQ